VLTAHGSLFRLPSCEISVEGSVECGGDPVEIQGDAEIF